MKLYTVILLYPDYDTDNFGQDTYCTHVRAEDPVAAVHAARTEIVSTAEDAEPEDYHVIAVFAGRHDDLWPAGV